MEQAFIIQLQNSDGAPAWYAADAGRRFGQPHAWVSDRNEALMFARAKDAQAFLTTFLPGSVAYSTIVPHQVPA